MRRMFLVGERQFRRTFIEAKKSRGVTGEALLRILECRLDNVVFRGGLAESRAQARQLVTHKFFLVNGRVVDRPSYRIKSGDVIEVKPEKKKSTFYTLKRENGFVHPPKNFWLSLDEENLKVTVNRLPQREEMEQNVDELLVVEYYSNRI